MRINIFKNQYKDQDKHPDWRGKMEVDELTPDGKKVESKIYVQDLEWFLQNTDIKSLKSAEREFRRFKKQKYRINISQ